MYVLWSTDGYGIRNKGGGATRFCPVSYIEKGRKKCNSVFCIAYGDCPDEPIDITFRPNRLLLPFYRFLSLSFSSSPVTLVFLYSSPTFFYSSSISSVMFLYLAVMFALELDHFLHQPRSFPHYSLFAFAFSERNKKRSE